MSRTAQALALIVALLAIAPARAQSVVAPPWAGSTEALDLLLEPGRARRVMRVGDSHCAPYAAERFGGSIAQGWALDWVGYRATYGQPGWDEDTWTSYPRTGGATLSVPGHLCDWGQTNTWGGMAAIRGDEPNTSLPFVQHFLSARLPYVGGNPWGVQLQARPIVHLPDAPDAGRVWSVWGRRGSVNGTSYVWDLTGAAPGLHVGPWVTVPAGHGIDAQLQYRGTPWQDTNGHVYGPRGAQFAIFDHGAPKPGAWLDEWAYSGWETHDHLRRTGPGRHYTDEALTDYLAATRLRPDEAIVFAVLLYHGDGGNTPTQTVANLAGVMDRLRVCATVAGYSDVAYLLIHPWYSPTTPLAHQREQWRLTAALVDARPDAAAISIAEATGYRLFGQYLDAGLLHIATDEGQRYMGRLTWSLIERAHAEPSAMLRERR